MLIQVVHCHPLVESYNHALFRTIVETLKQNGHEVVSTDLYREGFQPAMTERERRTYMDMSYDKSAVAGYAKTLKEVEGVILCFPHWWFSMPAMLKGWVDRVFSRGFAYSAGRKYESGHFKGKRAMLCLTTGTASTLYEANGIDGDLLHVLWPIHNGILGYTGFTVLPPFAAWMPARVSDEVRAGYLGDYRQRLESLDTTQALYFHPWSDYDETQRLKPGVRALSGVQWNPRADQTFEASASDAAASRS